MEKVTKLKLPTTTLIAVAGNRQAETIASLYKSMAKVDFAVVKLITNIDISASGIEVIKVDGLKSWNDYNHFIVKELYKYFSTDYCLICQWDSWVLAPECWTNEFLEYDIVGAPGLYTDTRNVQNGGFSLRSYRFQKLIALDGNIDITSPEDEILWRLYRFYLERTYGVKYCPDDLAENFSFELREPLAKTFGFHAFHWPHFRETVVIKRQEALGDIILLEPLLHYYHQKGYQVSLDTQPQFMSVYSQHYFPVVPKEHLNPKLPYKEVILDMAYEIKPRQPVLQSYFEMAGIKDYKLRNSRLNLFSGEGAKLFSKFVLIHINKTDMPYRNLHGINWKEIVSFLEEKGYLVFQIGTNEQEAIATPINTMDLQFMMFLIKGADLFLGSDSGPANIAVGFSIPSVIFYGSVNPANRIIDFERVRVIQGKCPSESDKHCYHKVISTRGKDCVHDEKTPPCTIYNSDSVIKAIKSLI